MHPGLECLTISRDMELAPRKDFRSASNSWNICALCFHNWIGLDVVTALVLGILIMELEIEESFL